MYKKLKGYKTMVLNTLSIVIIALLENLPPLKGTINPELYLYIACGLGVINMILRSVTTTPLGKSE